MKEEFNLKLSKPELKALRDIFYDKNPKKILTKEANAVFRKVEATYWKSKPIIF